MNTEQSKRPGWVIGVIIWYGVSLAYTLIFFAISRTELFQRFWSEVLSEMKEHERQSMESLFSMVGTVDYALMAISLILGVAAAITLFMMKKLSVKLWLAKVVISALAFTYYLLFTNMHSTAMELGGVSPESYLFALIDVAIYFGARNLDKKGLLS